MNGLPWHFECADEPHHKRQRSTRVCLKSNHNHERVHSPSCIVMKKTAHAHTHTLNVATFQIQYIDISGTVSSHIHRIAYCPWASATPCFIHACMHTRHSTSCLRYLEHFWWEERRHSSPPPPPKEKGKASITCSDKKAHISSRSLNSAGEKIGGTMGGGGNHKKD